MRRSEGSPTTASAWFYLEEDTVANLFGEVDPVRAGRGRPRHIVTAAQRTTVRKMVAAGLPLLRIAAAVGLTKPTLLRHFSGEIGRPDRTPDRQYERLRGGGRKRHVPTQHTRRLVVEMRANGATIEQLAKLLRIGKITVRTSYRDELIAQTAAEAPLL